MNLIRVMPAEGDESDSIIGPMSPPLERAGGTNMRHILTSLFAAILSVAAAGAAIAADKPTLTVYTYSGFASEWGPGPAIKTAFEAECGCTLEYVTLEDGVSLLTRLRLEGESTDADIILGLDTNLTAEAADTGLFAPHEADTSHLTLPVEWTDPLFVPFDYGYFAFVYDKTKLPEPPDSFEALINGDPEQKILIQDPRTSTPGLGLVLWIKHVYGEKAPDAWAKLKRRVLTVSKGWTESYGLFTEGEAPMVLSWTTSPAYHIIAEQDERFAAAAFSEGHYMQVEVAGRTRVSDEPELAKRFLAFILSPGFQDVIPTGNWMYPVAPTSGPLPPAYDTLVKPAKVMLFTPEEVRENRKAWTDEWLSVMSE
jgi:thiamine transport system substrate-binding protein